MRARSADPGKVLLLAYEMEVLGEESANVIDQAAYKGMAAVLRYCAQRSLEDLRDGKAKEE
jgi:hypothetical protein